MSANSSGGSSNFKGKGLLPQVRIFSTQEGGGGLKTPKWQKLGEIYNKLPFNPIHVFFLCTNKTFLTIKKLAKLTFK